MFFNAYYGKNGLNGRAVWTRGPREEVVIDLIYT